MTSKLDLVVVFTAVAGVTLGLEHSHHVFTDLPTHRELSAQAAAARCPDNDTMPYPASCLAFMESSGASDRRRPVRAPATTSARVIEGSATIRRDSIPPDACPTNDNVPYRANCLAFLSGWYWHPDAVEPPPSARRRLR
jgi:hypothetical protein